TRARHRATDVQQDVQVQVRVAVEILDVEPMLPGEELPVNVPRVVPLHILVMRGELDAEPDVRAAMQTVQETFDDRPRTQLDAIEAREELGVGQFAGVDHGFGSLRGSPRSRKRYASSGLWFL